jgi:hypothetical protein
MNNKRKMKKKKKDEKGNITTSNNEIRESSWNTSKTYTLINWKSRRIEQSSRCIWPTKIELTGYKSIKQIISTIINEIEEDIVYQQGSA